MKLDFSSLPLRNRAFSETPLTFVDQQSKSFLSAIFDLALIETGNRTAREYWQQKQLQNLLRHAAQRSPFWRKRIGTARFKDIALGELPILSRRELNEQVKSEGSLVKPNEHGRVIIHSTSGSSGIPVEFHQTERNSTYYGVRAAAQYFIEGRDLSLNRTRLLQSKKTDKAGFTVRRDKSWIEPMEQLVRTGGNKHIEYFRPDIDELCKELLRDPVGYLVVSPRLLEEMLRAVGAEFFSRAGTAKYMTIGEAVPPEMRAAFAAQGVPVGGNYSCEEAGMIGYECEHFADAYHVATSNVIIEVPEEGAIRLRGNSVGKVLVTHLHSYATPFIRYDVGDVATLRDSCECGHDGPVLTNVFGRAKSLVKHADGRVTLFFPRAREFAAIAKFDEYRVRQTSVESIVVELGGRDSLSSEEEAAFTALIKRHAGDEFDVRVLAVRKIDWGSSLKRLGFVSEV